MSRWERGVERGLGYLGLFLIGGMARLADHFGAIRGPERVTGKAPGQRWTSEKEAAR
jgi:hypothetical protein